jgi:hypothetical protein
MTFYNELSRFDSCAPEAANDTNALALFRYSTGAIAISDDRALCLKKGTSVSLFDYGIGDSVTTNGLCGMITTDSFTNCGSGGRLSLKLPGAKSGFLVSGITARIGMPMVINDFSPPREIVLNPQPNMKHADAIRQHVAEATVVSICYEDKYLTYKLGTLESLSMSRSLFVPVMEDEKIVEPLPFMPFTVAAYDNDASRLTVKLTVADDLFFGNRPVAKTVIPVRIWLAGRTVVEPELGNLELNK